MYRHASLLWWWPFITDEDEDDSDDEVEEDAQKKSKILQSSPEPPTKRLKTLRPWTTLPLLEPYLDMGISNVLIIQGA